MTFASKTKVPVDQSRAEVERTLARYGAASFAYLTQGGRAVIMFEAHYRRIRFELPLPEGTSDRDNQIRLTPSHGRREMTATMTDRTVHPAKGCTKRQIEAFERIAIGDDTSIAPAAAAALVKRGIIECYTEILPGRFPVKIRRYSVPLDIHYQWCRWCSQNVDEREATKDADR